MKWKWFFLFDEKADGVIKKKTYETAYNSNMTRMVWFKISNAFTNQKIEKKVTNRK